MNPHPDYMGIAVGLLFIIDGLRRLLSREAGSMPTLLRAAILIAYLAIGSGFALQSIYAFPNLWPIAAAFGLAVPLVIGTAIYCHRHHAPSLVTPRSESRL